MPPTADRSSPSALHERDDEVFRRLGVAVEGWPFVLVPAAVGLAALAAGWLAIAVPAAAAALAAAFFFRDPPRRVPAGDDVAVAPADGRVLHVDAGPEGLRVAIFLSIFDVHVNRVPVAGTVRRVAYRPGRFVAAFRSGAERVNERNAVAIETARGGVEVVQIAGWIARRIVCRVRPGDRVEAGQRLGLIRFGSRTDVVLPAGWRAEVARGQRVRAGETVVARWTGADA